MRLIPRRSRRRSRAVVAAAAAAAAAADDVVERLLVPSEGGRPLRLSLGQSERSFAAPPSHYPENETPSE